MARPEPSNGETLHRWLRLLGWQIQTGHDGEYVVGVATHFAADDSTLRVAGCARNEGELALQMFEQAIRASARVSEQAREQLTVA